MTALTALAQALAVESGRAQLIRTVRHVHLSNRPLVVIPLKLAGEAAAPLAALAGDDRGRPRLLTVYEPRNRTQRFEFAARLAQTMILPYIEGYAAGTPGEKESYPNAPQILVPGPAAAGFIRLLGRSTRFRRTDGEWAVDPSVPLLGRWLTYYAERAEHPGSSLLLPMTAALTEHWATGQSAVEDQNLAALIGWIDPPPRQTGLQAARAAEDPRQWPPAGPATDPDFDKDVLQGLIEAVRDATSAGDAAALGRARAAMDAALMTQVETTWELMWRGVDLLRSLPEGAHVRKRWDSDRWSFTGNVRYLREGGFPQARRDNAVRAARRLTEMERELEQLTLGTAYDDPLVMAEYRMTGEAFRGTVVAADADRRVKEPGKRGPGAKRPVIVVETTEPVTADEGTKVACPYYPKQKGVVLHPPVTDDGGTARVTIELSGGMGGGAVIPPGTMPALGETVLYTTLTDDFMSAPKFPAVELTPWTHGGPPPPYVPNDQDGNEAWQ